MPPKLQLNSLQDIVTLNKTMPPAHTCKKLLESGKTREVFQLLVRAAFRPPRFCSQHTLFSRAAVNRRNRTNKDNKHDNTHERLLKALRRLQCGGYRGDASSDATRAATAISI